MPRINIEEKWWSDPRRAFLIAKIGMLADSAMLNAIRVSQDFNGLPFDITGKIPDEWIQALISVGLAIGQATRFYLCGSKEHHDWISSQRERAALGGRASCAKRRAIAQPNAQPISQANAQANAQPSSSLLLLKNNTPSEAKASSAYPERRKLEIGELEKFQNNLATNLDINNIHLSRSLAVNFLRNFPSLSDAEDYLQGPFKKGWDKFPSDGAAVLDFLRGVMANLNKAEKEERENGN